MATIRALSLIALCVFDTSLQKTPGGAGTHTGPVLYMLHCEFIVPSGSPALCSHAPHLTTFSARVHDARRKTYCSSVWLLRRSLPTPVVSCSRSKRLLPTAHQASPTAVRLPSACISQKAVAASFGAGQPRTQYLARTVVPSGKLNAAACRVSGDRPPCRAPQPTTRPLRVCIAVQTTEPPWNLAAHGLETCLEMQTRARAAPSARARTVARIMSSRTRPRSAWTSSVAARPAGARFVPHALGGSRCLRGSTPSHHMRSRSAPSQPSWSCLYPAARVRQGPYRPSSSRDVSRGMNAPQRSHGVPISYRIGYPPSFHRTWRPIGLSAAGRPRQSAICWLHIATRGRSSLRRTSPCSF